MFKNDNYCIYGLYDDAAIICKNRKIELLGDVFIVDKHVVKQISYFYNEYSSLARATNY